MLMKTRPPEADPSPVESGTPVSGGLVPDADTVLFANKVEKTYDNGTHALDELSLRIQKGDFVSLLGPSGCGKSTLLKMFAGLESPSHGHLRWQGADAPAKSGLRTAMVFQEATLMPWADIETNVRLPLDLAHVSRAEAQQRVARALEQVGLARFAKSYPRELSGGMQMRVSIARALATEPDVLLMDEPFAALDAISRASMNEETLRLWAELGQTVLFITHDIDEAVFLADRVVVLNIAPGGVHSELTIDLPRPRNNLQTRRLPAFLDYRNELMERIAEVMAQSPLLLETSH